MGKNGGNGNRRNRSKMSNEDFVALWQSSPDLATVDERYDLGAKAAGARASRLRRRGISELKKFTTGRRIAIDVDALNKLAKKSLLKAKPEA